MTKYLFAGAGSPIGFIDFFDDILTVKEAKRRIFLKGSSGSGKSTLLKKINTALSAAGHGVEAFQCSNDINSWDGVCIPDIGISVVDATAPHSRDPQLPGGTDKIFDLAKYIDSAKIDDNKEELLKLFAHKKVLTNKAQALFAALGAIYDLPDLGLAPAHPLARRGFLSAITPDGLISNADEFFAGCDVVGIESPGEAGIGEFLAHKQAAAHAAGLATRAFYNPLAPSHIQHLLIPAENKAYATISGYLPYTAQVKEKIHLPEIPTIGRIFEKDDELFNAILENTIETMLDSRKLHMRIEEIYVDAVNFRNLDALTESVIAEIISSSE